MATEQQIAANRANAQLSTGPRTDAGKAASSSNAVNHGLTSRGFIILPGQREAFDQLESDLRGSLIPSGPLQELIFKRVLMSSWNLHRCAEAEAESYRIFQKPWLDPMVSSDHEDIGRVRRYAREAENSMYKGMRELARLQEEAQVRKEIAAQAQTENQETAIAAAAEPQVLSEVCNIRQIMKSVAQLRRPEPKAESVTPANHNKANQPTAKPIEITRAAA